MTTTYDKLDTINDSLNDIKTAIINKGQTPSGDITTYATAIDNISQQTAVIDSLSITPTTSAQTITASGGVDGYSPISVAAVTSSIDANITAGNIKNGVTILGVTGDYTGSGSATLITKSITQNGTYNASSDNADGYSSVTVNVAGGGGYSELPSYQVSNGVASRRSGALTGNEFSGITSIGDSGLQSAFQSCRGLTGTVDLSSLTTVGDNGLYFAFSGCWSLESVDLSSLTTVGNYGLYYAFQNCYGLTGDLELSSLTSIGDNGLNGAFSSCESLISVDLSSLTTVGNHGLYCAFQNCYALESVDLSSLQSVGDSGLYFAFQGCTVLTGDLDLSSLTTVGDNGLNGAFSSCEGLGSVDLSLLQSVSASGLYSAFSLCSGLESFDLSSLTTVGDSGLKESFMDCGSLSSVNLPSLQSVGSEGLSYAFSGCGSLSSVNLPSLQSVGSEGLSYAFSDGGNLTGTVDFSSLTSIGAGGLGGAFAHTEIEHIYFRALTSDSFADNTVFDGMLTNVDDATVHFPSNLQSVIGSWSSVTSGFDGTNTTVLFDLTATE